MSKGHKRHSHSPETKEELKITELLEIIQKQQKQIERLEQMVQQQQAEIEYLKRIGKRQAGKGKFAHRKLPKVVKRLETKEAKLHGCPECGNRLQASTFAASRTDFASHGSRRGDGRSASQGAGSQPEASSGGLVRQGQ